MDKGPFPKKGNLGKAENYRGINYPDLNRSQDIQSDASKSNSTLRWNKFYAETKMASDKVDQLADKFLPLEGF